MVERSSERAGKLTTTANRLRAVESDFAEQSPELRQKYLLEEVRRAVRGMTPPEQAAFVAELRQQFPALPADNPSAGETDDLAAAVEKLVRSAPDFTPEQQQMVIGQLWQVGLIAVGDTGWSEAAVNAFCDSLHLRTDEAIDPASVLDMAHLLSDFACPLHQLAWGFLRQIAPHRQLRPSPPLQRTLASYVSSSVELDRARLAAELDRLKVLIAAVIGAIGQVGNQFATKFLNKFAPPEIEMAVRTEGKKAWESMATACWHRYAELIEGMDHAAIENEIRDVVADYVEQVLKGAGTEEAAGAESADEPRRHKDTKN